MVMFNLVLVHLMIIFLHMIIIFKMVRLLNTLQQEQWQVDCLQQLSTVKVIDTNKFKLCDVGVSSQRNLTNYNKNKTVVIRGLGSGKHTIKYPPIVVKIESLSAIGSTTIIQPEIDPLVLGSIDNVYLEDGGIGYGCTNIMDFHRRPDVGISTVVFQALLKPIVIDGSIVDVQILASGQGYRVTLILTYSVLQEVLLILDLSSLVTKLLMCKYLTVV